MDILEIKALTEYIEKPLTLGDIEAEGEFALETANSLVLATQADADKASADRDVMVKEIDKVLAKIEPYKQKANKLHKYFTGLEKTLDGFEEARKITNEKLAEHEIKKREDAERAQEMADAAERLRAQEEAKESGDIRLSEAIKTGVVPVCAEPVEIIKTKGTVFAGKWTFKVINEKLIPDEYMIKTVDKKKLQKLATSRKEHAQVSGVEFYDELKARKASDKLSQTHW